MSDLNPTCINMINFLNLNVSMHIMQTFYTVYVFFCTEEENFSNNQYLFHLFIISFFLFV